MKHKNPTKLHQKQDLTYSKACSTQGTSHLGPFINASIPTPPPTGPGALYKRSPGLPLPTCMDHPVRTQLWLVAVGWGGGCCALFCFICPYQAVL